MNKNPIPYYQILEHQPITGTKRFTQTLHVKMYGAIEEWGRLNTMDEDNHFIAKADNLAKILNTTLTKAKNVRTDLIKLGWCTATRNKYGEIITLTALPVTHLNLENKQ